MPKKISVWSVGRVAERSGVTVATLHFYEREGLISSWRSSGNQRRFEPSVLRRVAVIKTAQRIGISLQEIRNAFSSLPSNRTPTKADWKKMSMTWRKILQQRIDQLEQLRDQLDGCIGCGCLSIKSCALRNRNDKAAEKGSGPVFWR